MLTSLGSSIAELEGNHVVRLYTMHSSYYLDENEENIAHLAEKFETERFVMYSM